MEVGDDVKVKEEVAESKEEAPKAEEPKPEPPKEEPKAKAPKAEAPAGGKVLATPAVRSLATEMKIDLTKVTPTGKGGRITKNDVLKYAESMKSGAPSAPAASAAPSASKADQFIPIQIPKALEHDQPKKCTGIRRAMVKSMTDALSIPPYNLQEEVCIDEIKRIRKDYVKLHPGNKITYLPFFIKAFSQAMLE